MTWLPAVTVLPVLGLVIDVEDSAPVASRPVVAVPCDGEKGANPGSYTAVTWSGEVETEAGAAADEHDALDWFAVEDANSVAVHTGPPATATATDPLGGTDVEVALVLVTAAL